MRRELRRPMQIDARVLSQLACPVCWGGLRIEESHLVCAACSRAYPIVDGIPVLIADRAETSSEQPR